MTQGGPAQPVITSTDAPIGGPALPAYGYVAATLDRPVAGGAAQPVYVVSEAEFTAGRFVKAGGAAQPLALVTDGRVVVGQRPVPVYLVGGSLSPVPPPISESILTELDTEILTEADEPILTE